jgi:ATP-dependent Clp protease ATP-binding subunit ClpB
LRDKEIELRVGEEGRALLAELGFNPLYGARPLGRVIQSRLQDPLAQKLLEGAIPEGATVLVEAEDGELVIRAADEAAAVGAAIAGASTAAATGAATAEAS